VVKKSVDFAGNKWKTGDFTGIVGKTVVLPYWVGNDGKLAELICSVQDGYLRVLCEFPTVSGGNVKTDVESRSNNPVFFPIWDTVYRFHGFPVFSLAKMLWGFSFPVVFRRNMVEFPKESGSYTVVFRTDSDQSICREPAGSGMMLSGRFLSEIRGNESVLRWVPSRFGGRNHQPEEWCSN
jgi:hypothetical protein